jgi:hypothetical protein
VQCTQRIRVLCSLEPMAREEVFWKDALIAAREKRNLTG